MRRAGLDDEAEQDALASIAATRRRLRRGAGAAAAAAAAAAKGDDDEEDGGMARLLAEQRVFLSSQQAPAARVVRHGDAASAVTGHEGASPPTAAAAVAAINGNGKDTSHQEPAADALPPVMLGGVVEREVTCKPMPISIGGGTSRCAAVAAAAAGGRGLGGAPRGFPQPVHRNERRRQQQQMMGEAEGEGSSSDSGRDDDDEDDGVQGPSASAGGGPLNEMEAANLARLARMSPGELQALQAEAAALFSPEALAVLQARGRPSSRVNGQEEEEEEGEVVDAEARERERETRRAELLRRDLRTEAALERAVAELLDEEERAKLAWTREVEPQAQQEEGASRLLRVDLEGRILETQTNDSSSPPRHSGLYHNPEQRAGYTLQHLCATARSSHTRQRALAFRTLSLLLRNPALGPALHRRGERLPVALPLVVAAGALGDRHRAARAGAVEALEALAVDAGGEAVKDEMVELSGGLVGLPPSSQGVFGRFGGAGGSGGGEQEERDQEQDEDGDMPSLRTDPFATEEERATDAALASEERRLLREEGGLPREEQEEGEAEAPVPIGTACARACARDAPLALHRWGVLRALATRAAAAMLKRTKEGEGGEVVDVELLPSLRLLGWAAHRAQGLARTVAFGYDERLLDACARQAMAGLTDPLAAAPAASATAAALILLRRLAQGSRAACLALGARGLLRALKGNLRLASSPSSNGETDGEGEEEEEEEEEAQPHQRRHGGDERRVVLETLRLWRVALGHGADLESLLDVLALLIASQPGSTPSAPGDGGGEGDTNGGPTRSAGPEGGGDLGGLVARWPAAAAAAWYRCLEEACATATAALRWQAQRQQQQQQQQQRTEKGEGKKSAPQQQQPQPPPFPACALAPATLAECTGRLAALAAGAWSEEAGEMRSLDLGNLEALCVRVARLHFVAAALEAGVLLVSASMRAELTALLNAVFGSADDERPSLLLGAVAELKRRLLLPKRIELEEEGGQEGPPEGLVSLWRVDLLSALIRLSTGRGLVEGEPGAAVARALVERAAAALDQQEAWQEAAAAAGLVGDASSSSCLAWTARRLLVWTEVAALEALLASSPLQVQAQARRLLALCVPGQEWEARGLIVLGLGGGQEKEEENETAVLRRLFTSVLAEESALTQGRLLADKSPQPARASLLLSPRLAPPHTLLPLPPHWALLPLASSLPTGSTAVATTATHILRSTLRFLLRDDVWRSYTALLPPGLPLYHLLCLGLFPYETFAGADGEAVALLAADLGRRALQLLPASGTDSLPTAVASAAALAEGAAQAQQQGQVGEEEEQQQRLVTLGEDLLAAASEGGISAPAAWAMRLLLRRAWGSSPCRVELWRGLHRAGMLHAVDDIEGEEEGAEGLAPYLDPAERSAEMLDLYAESLAGTAALAPVSPTKGGLAWLMALRHLGFHVWGEGGDEAITLSESARRRLSRVLRGVVAASETLDAESDVIAITPLCLLGYRGVPAAVLEEGEGQRRLSVPAAVARLVAWAEDVRAGRAALELGAKERGALTRLLAEDREEWRRVLGRACSQALAAVEEG